MGNQLDANEPDDVVRGGVDMTICGAELALRTGPVLSTDRAAVILSHEKSHKRPDVMPSFR